jgi:two-component system, NarL family, sensor histidine kinase UhpB
MKEETGEAIANGRNPRSGVGGLPLELQPENQWLPSARGNAADRAACNSCTLPELNVQATLAEQRERQRLAMNLHDEVGQALAAARIHLQALREAQSGNGGADLSDRFDTVFELLDQAVARTRTLTSQLASPVLHELGLGPAVQWLTQEYHRLHRIPVTLHNDGSGERLDSERQLLLFESVRELLMNVVKHARAGRVQICITGGDDCLQVAVEDDGVGFEVSPDHKCTSEASRFGLFSVQLRVKHLQGTFGVESAPGQGTKVLMTIPLPDTPSPAGGER